MRRELRRRRLVRTAGASIAVALVIAGCGELPAVGNGPYWLVKVQGDYANVYRYPKGNHPGTSEAIELGNTHGTAVVRAAAKRLGIPLSHVYYES